MAKIVLNEVTGGFNLQTVNSNFQKIAEHFNDRALYRDNPVGEPNQLKTDVDANGKRVYNLPAPVEDHEAARFKEVKEALVGLGALQGAVEEAENAADRANSSAIDAENSATKSEEYADAILDSGFKIFITKAEANSEIGSVPEGAFVKVLNDESRGGSQVIYQVVSGVYQFVKVLNDVGELERKIRNDVLPDEGSGMVGHLNENGESTTVREELLINASKLSELSGLKTNSTVKSLLKSQAGNIYVLMQGDSTGVHDTGFYRLMVSKVAQDYPAWRVVYIPWVHDDTEWGAQQVVQEGTNGLTVYFYNGSHSGAVPVYWRGAVRNQKAFDGKVFDVIITNYGLNVPTSFEYQTYAMAEYFMDLRKEQPKAEIIVNIQPPDYNLMDRSIARLKGQRFVCEQYGCQFVDAYGLFLDLVESTGVIGDWYVDGIHPNEEGHKRWAEIMYSSFITADLSGFRNSSKIAPVIVPNGAFKYWNKGPNDTPLFWKTTNTAIRNTVDFESDISSARFAGHTLGTGTAYIDPAPIINATKHLSGFWVAARVFCSGHSNKPGTLYFAKNVLTNYTDIRGSQYYQDYIHGGWRWSMMYVPKSFLEGATDLRLGVFSGEDLETVSIDRILISDSPVFDDYNGEQEGRYEVSYNDTSFDVPANSSSSRGFAFPASEVGAYGTVRVNGQNGSLIVSVMPGNGSVQVTFTNTSAGLLTQGAYSLRLTVE